MVGTVARVARYIIPLCRAQVVIPPPEQRIAGGAVDRTGDYTEAGIEQSNRDRPDIMTAGALAFWQKHAIDSANNQRPTIAYAVSVDHAHNLAAVFNEAGVSAAVILGDTNREERDRAIAGFRDGSIKVLVNVIVATEGFDLPDASCIIIARPTMSLALYLQMVGRGLRPKPNGGDCLILDLAGNAVTHGLPEQYREWSLKPRGYENPGESPIIWCHLCETASFAASQNCQGCGAPYGKGCDRCGKWRAWKRWEYENYCGDDHQLVCDHCHIDAHIQTDLPITAPLDQLVELRDTEDATTFINEIETNDLDNRLSALFHDILEQELHRFAQEEDARREELLENFAWLEYVLSNDTELDRGFLEYIDGLTEQECPVSRSAENRLFDAWVGNLRAKLESMRTELFHFESRPIDKKLICFRAQDRVNAVLFHQIQAAGLFDYSQLAMHRVESGNDPMPTTTQPKRFYFGPNRNGVYAKCDVYSPSEIVVLAGSTSSKRKMRDRGNYQYWKDQLIEHGTLADSGQLYVFTKDCRFASATRAAAIVLGDTAKARQNLKDANGIPFAEYYPR